MKLVVGFGNPESKYNFTRHNTGFLALDFYAKVNGLNWESASKFNAIWLKTTIPNSREQVIFIKPQTYYNNVGEAIQAFAHFYKITTPNILIICDDFNLDFGKIRFRESGSAGGNNGLKSTIACLNTENFPRLRIGTDNAMRTSSNVDFVLSKFTPEEKENLPALLRSVTAEIDNWLEV